MIPIQLEIQLVAVLAATACALAGAFLVLRREALLSDAISHVVLLGIVVMFFIVKDLRSPLLIVGAAGAGLLTVTLTGLLQQSRLVREDAAVGLVFPMLFSIGVILVARSAGNIHLDTDAVLLGELAFTPFDRFVVGDLDFGPRHAWVMGTILLVNVVFLSLCYKELKIATFDPALAAALGFSPALIHYLLLSVVSVTAVGAFDAVGAVLVVALMIVPPATAYLLTDRLVVMLSLSVAIGILSAIAGYWLAHLLDTSIAGSMVMVSGVVFGAALLGAPQRGLVARALNQSQQRWAFAERVLVMHLLTHAGKEAEYQESLLESLPDHLHWEEPFVRDVARRAERHGLIRSRNGRLSLTPRGRTLAQEVMIYSKA